MYCTDAFPRELKKKIDKTREGRGGKGIYKRRNSRSYRVIIHYNTYLKIIKNNKNFLRKYERGYVVRLRPDDYFDKKGNKKVSFHKSLILGKNAFIYFKNINDWNKYKSKCSNFEEVVELYTTNDEINNNDQWKGEYCKFITNATPQQISLICSSGTKTDEEILKLNELKTTYGNDIPKQAGLGNYDYDYASDKEIKNVCYQLSMMLFRVPGMKKYLKKLTPDINETKIRVPGMKKYLKKLTPDINEVEKHIIDYCTLNKLSEFKKLVKIRALDKKKFIPICPLCLTKLDAKSFFEVAKQDEGREEEDNTQSEIVLMHIDALTPAKFNHHTYNLGWGHKDCNTIQGPKSIEETLVKLKEIVSNQKNF